jgi:hypothetical protein
MMSKRDYFDDKLGTNSMPEQDDERYKKCYNLRARVGGQYRVRRKESGDACDGYKHRPIFFVL